MNLLLFVVALIVSFIVVRIGAIAFQLTGMDWGIAKFQSLSCFSGTGFTTKEAELITGHPVRRKIASILMVLGNVGLVTLIATFANSLRPVAGFTILNIFPFLKKIIPMRLLPIVNLLIIIISTYIIFRIFTYKKLINKFTIFIRSKIKKKKIIPPAPLERYFMITDTYGVAHFEICKGSPLDGKTIKKVLNEIDIKVLALEKKENLFLDPSKTTKISSGDKISCFGAIDDIRSLICKP